MSAPPAPSLLFRVPCAEEKLSAFPELNSRPARLHQIPLDFSFFSSKLTANGSKLPATPESAPSSGHGTRPTSHGSPNPFISHTYSRPARKPRTSNTYAKTGGYPPCGKCRPADIFHFSPPFPLFRSAPPNSSPEHGTRSTGHTGSPRPSAYSAPLRCLFSSPRAPLVTRHSPLPFTHRTTPPPPPTTSTDPASAQTHAPHIPRTPSPRSRASRPPTPLPACRPTHAAPARLRYENAPAT